MPSHPSGLRATPFIGRMLIDGMLDEGSGGWMDSIDPAHDAIIGRVPLGTPGDVERAVAAAQRAQPAWAGLSVVQRAGHMNRLADVIAANASALLVLEGGRFGQLDHRDERRHRQRGWSALRYFAGLGYELQGTTIPGSDDRLSLTWREPYGVVGRIGAFNHPIAMAVNGIAAALMAGNTMVLKPSEQCSLSTALLGDLSREALPAGRTECRHRRAGRGQRHRAPSAREATVVRRLGTDRARHPAQRCRSGSQGWYRSNSAARTRFVLFPDAPLDKAVDAAVLGMNFIWQGPVVQFDQPAAGARQRVRGSGATSRRTGSRGSHRRSV